MNYHTFFIFFVLQFCSKASVLTENPTDNKSNKKETFDEAINRVYNHINDVKKTERKLEYQSLIPYYMPYG